MNANTFTQMDAVARLDVAIQDGRIEKDATFIHQGDASIVRAVGLLECLSPNEAPSSPADIPLHIMPAAVAWGLMTIADEVDGRERLALAKAIRSFIEEGSTPDRWHQVAIRMNAHVTRLSVDVVNQIFAPIDGSNAVVMALHRLVSACETGDRHKIAIAASAVIKHPPSGFFSDPAIEDIVSGPVPVLASISNMVGFGERLAVWSARAAHGDHDAVRRGMLDLDFSAMLIANALCGVGVTPQHTAIWSTLKASALSSLMVEAVTPVVDLEKMRRRQNQSPTPSSPSV